MPWGLGRKRERTWPILGYQALGKGCSLGSGHSLGSPVRKELGQDRPRNQSLWPGFLGPTVDLNQAELAATDRMNRTLTRHFGGLPAPLSALLHACVWGNRRPGQEALRGDAGGEMTVTLSTALPPGVCAGGQEAPAPARGGWPSVHTSQVCSPEAWPSVTSTSPVDSFLRERSK